MFSAYGSCEYVELMPYMDLWWLVLEQARKQIQMFCLFICCRLAWLARAYHQHSRSR